ncbi:pol-related protein [Clonorchis sinensis]|uniref:Pol-related protein n=1 Tax=Clonorchis sinensis TaxID=79923 RepID=G7YAZ3_CLOSI|nr:pol-related protein [Clonorchis sinensis]
MARDLEISLTRKDAMSIISPEGDFNSPKAPWTEIQCVGSSGPFSAALTEVVHQRATLYSGRWTGTGRTKDVILIERVQRAASKVVAGLKSIDYETRLAVLDLFPLEYRRLRGDSVLIYALFEQGLANRFFTVDPANARRGHGERQPLNDKNKTDPGNLGESLDPVYQSVNP